MSEVTLIETEPSTVACCRCKQVIRTEKGVSTYLGNLQDYESTHKPVSGWLTACEECKIDDVCGVELDEELIEVLEEKP